MSRLRTSSHKDLTTLPKTRTQQPTKAKTLNKLSSFFTAKRRAASPTYSSQLTGDAEGEKKRESRSFSKSPLTVAEDLHVSSSFELWAEMGRLERCIRSKVNMTYITARQQEESALLAKVESVENGPRRSRDLQRPEGLEYQEERKAETRSEEVSPGKRRTRSPSCRTEGRGRSVHSIIRREPPLLLLKTRKMIQRDIQQTQESSFQFLKSAQTMSRELSRCFLKAPIVRPASRQLAAVIRPRLV